MDSHGSGMFAGSQRLPVVGVWLAAVVVAALHAPALSLPYLSDDFNCIGVLARGEGVTLPKLLREFVSTWGSVPGATYYRPLTSLSLAFDLRLFGINPFGGHLTNLALHVLNALLVATIVRRLAPRAPAWTPAAAALFFGLHPATTEVTAWIVARVDSLATFFFLAAVIGHLGYRRTGRRRWLAFTVASAVGAFLAKESGLLVPVALVAIDLLDPASGETPRRGVSRLTLALLHAGLLAGLVGWRIAVVGGMYEHATLHVPWTSFDAAVTGLGNLGRALRLLVPWNPAALPTVAGVALVGIFAAVAAVALLARPWRGAGSAAVRTGLVIAAAQLALTSGLDTAPAAFHNTRHVYLAVAGLAVAFGGAWSAAARGRPRITVGATAVLLAALAATVPPGQAVWREAGDLTRRVIRAAHREASTAPDRWCVFLNVPEVGPRGGFVLMLGYPFALRSPFVSPACPRAVAVPRNSKLYHHHIDRLAVLRRSGGRVLVWRPRGGRFAEAPAAPPSPRAPARLDGGLTGLAPDGSLDLAATTSFAYRSTPPARRLRFCFVSSLAPLVFEAARSPDGDYPIPGRARRRLHRLAALGDAVPVLFWVETTDGPSGPARARSTPITLTVRP